MLPFPPAFTHADPAFAPRTRVRLAAAPATAWAAGLSVPTCLALLWALHEGFIAGEIMFRPGKAAADMPPAAMIACRDLHAALALCPRDELAAPREDAGFSDEFQRAWTAADGHRFKHTTWAGRITAAALPAMFAALDRCPPPILHPAMYLVTAVARTTTAHHAIAEIAAGVPLHPDELSARISQAIARGHAVTTLCYEFADQLGPRLEAALARQLPGGRIIGLLHDALLSFRGLDYDAFVARAHQHIARLRGLSDAELVALVLAAESAPRPR